MQQIGPAASVWRKMLSLPATRAGTGASAQLARTFSKSRGTRRALDVENVYKVSLESTIPDSLARV